MGHRGQRAGFGVLEEIWLGDRAERTYSPDDAEGGRKRDVSYGDVYGIPATATWLCTVAGADEGTGRSIEKGAGNHGCELRARPARAGGGGFNVGIKQDRSPHKPGNQI
jgi:hypothetical protein